MCKLGLISTILYAIAGIQFATASTHPSTFTLNQNWTLRPANRQFPEINQLFGSQDRIHAKVPGTIIWNLFRAQKISDPLIGKNILSLPETLCREPYLYENSFKLPQAIKNKYIILRLNGINYRAKVWLNSHYLGSIKGAFQRTDFNITGVVHRKQVNHLRIEVWPQPHFGTPHLKTIQTGTGRNGGITAMDGPTFFCSIGWDWIPTIPDRDTGIWQSVQILATGPVRLTQPFVHSDVHFHGGVRSSEVVSVRASNLVGKPMNVMLKGLIDNHPFTSGATIPAYSSRIITFKPSQCKALRMTNPKLWWPNGYGEPFLHRLTLTSLVNSRLSDSLSTQFGIRKLTYKWANSPNLTLVVNNVPVIAKGGDWGMDDELKHLTAKRMNAMIRMHAEANYTIIRNWCGQSTSPLLYHYCDKYGIMLWDEFFQPNPNDGPNPTDVSTYLANVKAKILRYRLHPSIALWCARNEGNPPPAINKALAQLIAQYDPQRLYQPSSTSGRGVNSGGPYHWRNPQAFYRFRSAFKTEIGSISVPTLQSIEAFLPKKDWNHVNNDWALHDFCAGAQQGDQYIRLMTARYGAPTSLSDFVRKAQMMNYEAFRAMYEGRLIKLLAPTSGIITWMSDPAQNSFVWQIYSHDLEPNASLFGAKKGCEVVHVMMNQVNDRPAVVNGSNHWLKGRLDEVVYGLSGTVTSHQSLPVSVGPLKTEAYHRLACVGRHLHFVWVRLLNMHQKLVSENFYWVGPSQNPQDLRELNTLPKVQLLVRGSDQLQNGLVHIQLSITNPSKVPVLLAHVQLRDSHGGERILPVFYSDNYLNLAPGESKQIIISAPVSGVNAFTIGFDGWNIRQESVRLASNLNLVTNPSPPQSGTWPKVKSVARAQ